MEIEPAVPSVSSITVDDLRTVALLANQPDEHLAWLAARCIERRAEPGEFVVRYGTEARHMVIVLQGLIQIFRPSGGIRRLFDTSGPGKITGLLPFSRMQVYGGDAVVVEPARLALIDKAHFSEMVHRMPDVGQALVAIITDRVRSATRGDQESEKMIALGKLSAGLAHELNNPSAAVKRAGGTLRDRLEQLARITRALATLAIEPDAWQAAEILVSTGRTNSGATLSAIERGDREEELAAWLEDREVADAWTCSEAMADAGISTDDLERLENKLSPEALGPVLSWVALNLGADRLLQEIEASTEKISHLVASVKAYSHMDRSPDKQRINVRDGIENTLTMLGHRLRSGGIEIDRQYAEALPEIDAYPGELNQVWTNLIDNAVDALPEGGRITVTARVMGAMLSVSITDTGHGIPADVQPRIFEPFFTTKEVGAGTGLGLEIVDRIVRQHEGDIQVESEPGRTTFRVMLPLAYAAT